MSLFDRLVREAMRRFLPSRLAGETVERPEFWTLLVDLLENESRRAIAAVSPRGPHRE